MIVRFTSLLSMETCGQALSVTGFIILLGLSRGVGAKVGSASDTGQTVGLNNIPIGMIGKMTVESTFISTVLIHFYSTGLSPRGYWMGKPGIVRDNVCLVGYSVPLSAGQPQRCAQPRES